MNIEEAISKRKSIRHYNGEPVTQEEIAKLLWAGSRCPSAGAIRPCKIHVVDDKDLKEKLCIAGLGQRCIAEAPIVLVVTADFAKMARRYRGRRGHRYIFMEAGHIGQNISLMAISLGLGCVMIGAFRDGEVKAILGVEEEPLYIIPVGRINAV